jgi:hypothetical protein
MPNRRLPPIYIRQTLLENYMPNRLPPSYIRALVLLSLLPNMAGGGGICFKIEISVKLIPYSSIPHQLPNDDDRAF